MKNLKLFLLIFILTFLTTTPTLAQGLSPDERQEINDAQDAASSNLSDFNAEIGLGTGTGGDLSSINSIISALLPITMILAGTILLFMLISGGFTMMTAVTDPKAADAGKTRITAALTGFFLLFAAYWIIQILEIVLGVSILS